MTFEEFKKNEMPEEFITVPEPGSETSINGYFIKLLVFQSQLKIMHWGTDSYAQHNAYGSTYSSIDETLDGLVESYQGYHGRIDFGCSCEFISFNKVESSAWLRSMLDCLISLKQSLKESDLQNMIDELIGHVSKLMYLLSLK